MAKSKRGRVIAIATSTGGRGKTTLAASIAGELLRRERAVSGPTSDST